MSGHLTPIRSIRLKCVDCMGSKKLVKNCEDKECPSWPYRMGKNPHRKGIGGRSNRGKI